MANDSFKEYPRVSMANIELNSTSPLRYKRLYRDDNGNDFFPLYLFQKEDFPEADDDTLHTVNAGEVGRLDYISNFYYKTPELWWVIGTINDIDDPLHDMIAGMVLRIPSIGRVYGALTGRKS